MCVCVSDNLALVDEFVVDVGEWETKRINP